MNNGILLVDKHQGVSSNYIVQFIKKKFSLDKIGHFGTLDPQATGLLVLGLNKATKLSKFFLNYDKCYLAEICLGAQTDTDDLEGQIIFSSNEIPSQDNIIKVINSFIGTQHQTPPVFSALKHKGKKLYELARMGTPVTKEPREINIYDIEIMEQSFPKYSFKISCSKGTYIRSLARDIGTGLGIGCHLSKLQRLSQGDFRISDAKDINNVEMSDLIHIKDAFKGYEKLMLSPEDTKKFVNGVGIQCNKGTKLLRVFSENKFIGLGSIKKDGCIKQEFLV